MNLSPNLMVNNCTFCCLNNVNFNIKKLKCLKFVLSIYHHWVGDDGSNRRPVRHGGLWSFLTALRSKLTVRTKKPSAKENLSAKEKALFCPKFAPKLPKVAKICPKIGHKLSKNNQLRTLFDNPSRTFFETVRPKIHLSKKSVCPSIKKSVHHEKGPSVGAYPLPPLSALSSFAEPPLPFPCQFCEHI